MNNISDKNNEEKIDDILDDKNIGKDIEIDSSKGS